MVCVVSDHMFVHPISISQLLPLTLSRLLHQPQWDDECHTIHHDLINQDIDNEIDDDEINTGTDEDGYHVLYRITKDLKHVQQEREKKKSMIWDTKENHIQERIWSLLLIAQLTPIPYYIISTTTTNTNTNTNTNTSTSYPYLWTLIHQHITWLILHMNKIIEDITYDVKGEKEYDGNPGKIGLECVYILIYSLGCVTSNVCCTWVTCLVHILLYFLFQFII